MPAASVIVRSLNKSATIEATLKSLRAQTIASEIIVVDSGSTDGTVEIARKYADKLIQIRPEEFSYGRALNLGAAEASAPIHFAVSAHIEIKDPRWIEKCLPHYDREDVAATNGGNTDLYGHPITEPFFQTAETPGYGVYWGFSNTTGSWRATVWERFAFREDLVASEDKEWSWRVLAAGHRIVYDPDIFVWSNHRRAEGLRKLCRRTFREGFAKTSMGALERPQFSAFVREWSSDFPYPSLRPPEPSRKPMIVRRLGRTRTLMLIARYLGERAGAKSVIEDPNMGNWPPVKASKVASNAAG